MRFVRAMGGVDLDHQVRLKAFNFLESQVAVYGEVLPWQVLSTGFLFEENRIPLVGPQGIFKPQVLDLPLTITTAPIVHGRPRPYNDGFEESGLLRYRYRGTDPNHRDNVGLREIMRRNLPLIYFHGIAKGRYMTCWPAYLVHDNPADLCFSVALDDRALARKEITLAETDESAVRRSYVRACPENRRFRFGPHVLLKQSYYLKPRGSRANTFVEQQEKMTAFGDTSPLGLPFRSRPLWI